MLQYLLLFSSRITAVFQPSSNMHSDYKRTCPDAALHVPLVIPGVPYKDGITVEDLVSTASLPKTTFTMAGVGVGDAMIGENLLDVVEKKNDNKSNHIFTQISESRVDRCVRTTEYLYSVYAPAAMQKRGADFQDDYIYLGNSIRTL